MSNGQPHVSVFHFTSQISKAKIRKYKLATERGMTPGRGRATPSEKLDLPSKTKTRPGHKPAPSSNPVDDSPSMEPPPIKKPRLKLNVRPRPSDSLGDTIAVSRPKRKSSLKIHYSQDMDVDSNRTSDPPPVNPSARSSLATAPAAASETPPSKPETPKSDREDYGDFMSYYVTGDDQEEDKPKPKTKTKPRRKSKPDLPLPLSETKESREVHQSKADPTLGLPPPADRPQQRKRRRSAPHARSAPSHSNGHMTLQHPLPPPPPIPQPIVHIVDVVYPPKPTEPDTVATVIRKLERLSDALTNFGGVPAVPQTPLPEQVAKVDVPPKVKKNPLDNFLSNFEDEDAEIEIEVKATKSPLDRPLENYGRSDDPLSYGIAFIMNALKSWAEQRMKHQFHQQYMAQQMQFRSAGRSKSGMAMQFPTNPVIQLNLSETPEGVAIAAFQAVLDTNCLQTNVVLPTELARALRHLYMQIDHLINQGFKHEPTWHCMSYSAQIVANKARVDRWKEAHAKAQEEMARQQQLAEQQVMMQMNLHGQLHRSATAAEANRAHELELERRRSMQHAAQQPYISQHHLNPLQLGSQSAVSAALGDSAPQSGAPRTLNGNSGVPTGLPSGAYNIPQAPSSLNKGGAAQVQLDRMKLYMPGFLPRSGQSMKFSFAPHNEAALRMFGSQAFPSGEPQGPSIPNRGPMNSSLPSMPASYASPNGEMEPSRAAMADHAEIEIIELDDSSPSKPNATVEDL